MPYYDLISVGWSGGWQWEPRSSSGSCWQEDKGPQETSTCCHRFFIV